MVQAKLAVAEIARFSHDVLTPPAAERRPGGLFFLSIGSREVSWITAQPLDWPTATTQNPLNGGARDKPYVIGGQALCLE